MTRPDEDIQINGQDQAEPSTADAVSEVQEAVAAGQVIHPQLALRVVEEVQRLRSGRARRAPEALETGGAEAEELAVLREEVGLLRGEVSRLRSENEKMLERLRNMPH